MSQSKKKYCVVSVRTVAWTVLASLMTKLLLRYVTAMTGPRYVTCILSLCTCVPKFSYNCCNTSICQELGPLDICILYSECKEVFEFLVPVIGLSGLQQRERVTEAGRALAVVLGRLETVIARVSRVDRAGRGCPACFRDSLCTLSTGKMPRSF
jgi:hypothetical protein